MGKKLDKFFLLMWKNWVLQYRKPVQTFIEIFAPVVFSVILVLIRSLSEPTLEEERIYKPFCTIPTQFNINNEVCQDPDALSLGTALFSDIPEKRNLSIVYTSSNEADFSKAMELLKELKVNVISVNTSKEIEEYSQRKDSLYIGIEVIGQSDKLKVAIRFPGETNYQLDTIGSKTWKTNLVYPMFQTAGPRSPDNATGSAPSYEAEGFLAVQHYITIAMMAVKNGITKIEDLVKFLHDNKIPLIYMRRFPYASWYSDVLLNSLTTMLGMIVMLSFVYTCINTVRSITTEKEKQLKESLKIMGLPNWLHWLAWFIKCFFFLLISVVLMVVLLKVNWYPKSDFTVFTYTDPFILLVFFILYACSTITFCFAISVLFSKANTAATMAGLLWFISYTPFIFLQNNYSQLSLATKLLLSLLTNSGMAFGFQVILMYEGTEEGSKWSNLFKPNTIDDNLSLGLVMLMFIVNSLMYLFIALYVEAVFPGEYGVPQKWYYLFTKRYWCGENTVVEEINGIDKIHNEFFEAEPTNLKAGIQIRNLRKEFGSKAAVRNLSLNMYENQITVLLGHNGAGKTTTMSMLTGMITPSSGNAKINGYDITTNISGVRESLGLCPQHNIIFDELTVAEHLYFFSRLKGLSKQEINGEINKYVNLLDLEPKRNAKSATLSGGMKRKLCVGIALCGNSKVVMLDEPTAGVDPSARRVLWELLQKQKENRTILLSTHFMDEADLLGDRIAIMAGGELQCCGSSFFLKKKYGAGYSLIMDKAKNCDPNKVTDLLRTVIPDIEIHSNVGSELTYLLAENYASSFETLLKQLESKSKELEIQSYGISLTTLEEVFMKVGADHGQEEEYNKKVNNAIKENDQKDKTPIIPLDKGPVSLAPAYTGGFDLAKNQFMAMMLKKIVGIWHSWILFVIQLCIPMITVIIALSVPNNVETETLPEMPLNLDKFENPVTLLDHDINNPYYLNYNNLLKTYGLYSVNDNITSRMLSMTAREPNTARRRYIIGASFDSSPEDPATIEVITAWFNNDPYHPPGITLGFVLSAIYKKFTNQFIEFSNKPLPFKAETQIDKILSGQSSGFQIAFNLGFSMAFVTSFYVIFLIRENASKSKHLQFVSGVKVYIFWAVHAIGDLIVYLIVIAVLLATIACFQQDGFKTADELGRLFVILLVFGVSFLPMYYLCSFLFSVPSTGYTRMTLIGIFIGTVAFLVVQVLTIPRLDLEDIGNSLHLIFLISPLYSMCSAISNCFTKYSYNKICSKYYVDSVCKDFDPNYYAWESPGIGKNITYSLIVSCVCTILLLVMEYKVFSRIIYFINQKLSPRSPIAVQDEDEDVAKEKEKIHNTSELQLTEVNMLVVKDLTKYYKRILAVNGLSLGISKSECFGLLGINGAGKTTTFKMMSGDESISYGDAWVAGNSVKTQLKKVQRHIGYCPQFDALLDDMTAKETIIMYCLLRGIEYKRTNNIAQYLSREFDFHRHLNKKVKEMSGGNKRKLSTVLSLIGDPPVIFLDEPTTGMDPATKRYLWDALSRLRDSGKCIVLTSHSMEECEALCTRLAIMVNGNFKCLGSTQHLKNKFAEGYTLTIKVKKLPESSGLQHSDTAPIENFIKQNFHGAHLREKHQELLNYYITDKSKPWSSMFGVLERGKRNSDLNIEDYSLGQSSLEQVFLTFTKYQNYQAN